MVLIKILVASMLGITGIIDFKTKKVNLLMIVPFFILGIICNLKYGVLSPTSIVGGMGIGVILIGIGIITGGKIGSGDGFVLIATGLFLGFYDNLFLVLTATFLVAVSGSILLLIKRVDKNYEIPFIPFLFISFLGDLILWS